jgi:hypothetical protein
MVVEETSAQIIPKTPLCWLWSLIIFMFHRSLFLAVFIPHENCTPLHAGGRGVVGGAYPPCRVWGQAGPRRGFGGEAPVLSHLFVKGGVFPKKLAFW